MVDAGEARSINLGWLWAKEKRRQKKFMEMTNEEFKQRIIAHCAYMAQHDRAYAIYAYKRYRESMPWLNL